MERERETEKYIEETEIHPKRIQRRWSSSEGDRPGRNRAFHETIVITVPLGPTGFLKIVFSRD